MRRSVPKLVLLVLAIALAVLPLVELVDHWESYGSDPEFVSVCTVAGIAFGILFAFRRAIVSCLSRLLPRLFSLSQLQALAPRSPDFPQAVFTPIRAPIRI